MSKSEAIQILCTHSFSSLPKSIAQRESILRAALVVLPKDSEVAIRVRELLFLLERHQQLQAELIGLSEHELSRRSSNAS